MARRMILSIAWIAPTPVVEHAESYSAVDIINVRRNVTWVSATPVLIRLSFKLLVLAENIQSKCLQVILITDNHVQIKYPFVACPAVEN